jgi:hypothetical protein
MTWLQGLADFFGGAFCANAIPHVVSGMMGRAFQSPFATPPGRGLSSSRVNVLWGALNLVVAYLILHAGRFDLREPLQAGIAGAGALFLALQLAHHFGQFHGGRLIPSA